MTVVLTRPAPIGGFTLNLETSVADTIPLPKTLTIPAGTRSMGVMISTRKVSTKTFVTVSISSEGYVRQFKVVVIP
jgi:hypothetical protein